MQMICANIQKSPNNACLSNMVFISVIFSKNQYLDLIKFIIMERYGIDMGRRPADRPTLQQILNYNYFSL